MTEWTSYCLSTSNQTKKTVSFIETISIRKMVDYYSYCVKFGVRVDPNAVAGRRCSMNKKPFYWGEHQGKNTKRTPYGGKDRQKSETKLLQKNKATSCINDPASSGTSLKGLLSKGSGTGVCWWKPGSGVLRWKPGKAAPSRGRGREERRHHRTAGQERLNYDIFFAKASRMFQSEFSIIKNNSNMSLADRICLYSSVLVTYVGLRAVWETVVLYLLPGPNNYLNTLQQNIPSNNICVHLFSIQLCKVENARPPI